jgi:lipoprotein signal peptidase
MKILTSRIFWGLVIILGGILMLLEALDVIESAGIFWGIAFIIAGIFFYSVYFGDRTHWWALIPGTILAGLGLGISLDQLFPAVGGDLIGPLFLGSIGLSFWLVYGVDRGNWWAIIPAGILTTLALVALAEPLVDDLAVGGVFFFGLGLTFALVALLPNPAGRMTWAWIPSLILIVIGVFVFAAAEELLLYIGPAALMIGGAVLLWRAVRPRG